MRIGKVFKQSLLLALLWPLLCTSVVAREAGVSRDTSVAHSPAGTDVSAAERASGFHLRGVLIVGSGRSALVNDKVAREGDRVGGAEILAIEEGAVRILMGSRELTVRVGSSALREPSQNPSFHVRRAPTGVKPVRERKLPVGAAPFQSRSPARPESHAHHGPVRPGETLSGIARRYMSDGVTMDQMMMALFIANPRAFSGNINVLHAGAVLRVPSEDERHRQSSEAATAEVTRHVQAWRTGHRQRTLLAETPGQGRHGPVRDGETLYGIAARVLPDGVTMNQMMLALFNANPQAFSGNINVLHEGAILQIPGLDRLQDQAPEIATAEVIQQMDAWRSDDWQRARSTTAFARVMASIGESVHPTVPPFR